MIVMKIDLFVRMQMRRQGILKSNQNGILRNKKENSSKHSVNKLYAKGYYKWTPVV